MTKPLQKAIDIAGGKIAMALAMGLDRTAIYKWADECPSDRVLAVCELTNWQVTPHELRPDLYPNPTDALPLITA
jgi:DNA-binding transcriptional regulator YdaS (Cro superfamily)